jgi:excisionase family DNA binding protein
MIRVDLPEVMTASETAEAFGVDVKTVARWEQGGKIRCFRTPGGHRRFFASEVRRVMLASEGRYGLEPDAGDGPESEPMF